MKIQTFSIFDLQQFIPQKYTFFMQNFCNPLSNHKNLFVKYASVNICIAIQNYFSGPSTETTTTHFTSFGNVVNSATPNRRAQTNIGKIF